MRKLALAIGALAITFATACGGDSTTQPTPASFAGTWSLQTVNGAALPFLVATNGSDKLEITSDVFTVTSSGTFDEMATTRTTISGVATVDTLNDSGTYTLNGSAVTLTFASDGSSIAGTLSGNSMTLTQAGYAFAYKKQ